MKSSWNWHHEAYLALATALAQITGSRKWRYKSRGLNQLKIHIAIERDKMTTSLWYAVMWHFNWTCQICGVQNFRNADLTKPKMQVDHVKALFNGGVTEWSNLQVLCIWCNKRKGVS